MTKQTEALKLADALNELLESFEKDGKFCKSSSIRNELYDHLKQTLEESKEALAQPEQEPAWYHAECDDPDHSGFFKEAIDAVTQVNEHGGFVTKLYTTPPQPKEQKDLELELALAGLVEKITGGLDSGNLLADAAIASKMLDAQPKEPEQEPVAYGMWDSMIGCGGRMMYVRLDKGQDGCTVPLYTTPPHRDGSAK